MAKKKISELIQATELHDSDLLAVVQENNEHELETRKATVGVLKNAILPSFQSSDGSLTVTEQGNQVDIRVANNNVAAGFVEDFPLSMAEGGQNVPVGFYGVRFTPGQNFIAKHAQICKRDNMTSGTFVVAIYSAGTTATGGRTEGMELLAQTTETPMNGNGIGTADFPESQQVELEADHEYYMVLYVQHPSSGTRGLICRKQNGNEWGNSNLTLAFSGNSQTVMETLGSSNFSTLFPSTGVNSMVLPYMKIYGDYVSMGSSSVGQQPSAQVLVITDNNVCQYLTQIEGESAETDVYLNLPENYNIVVLDTTSTYHIWKIKPEIGVEFPNYMKLMFMGNVTFIEGKEYQPANTGDYRISRFWNTYRSAPSAPNEAFIEFVLRNRVWYAVFY